MGPRLCDWKQQEGRKKKKTENRRKRWSDQYLQSNCTASLKSQQSFRGTVQCKLSVGEYDEMSNICVRMSLS